MNTFLNQNQSFIALQSVINTALDENSIKAFYNDKIQQLQKLRFTEIKREDFIYWYGDYKKAEMIVEFEKIPIIKNLFAEEIFLIAKATLFFFKPIADLLPLFANNTATEEDWEDLKWEQSFRDKPENINTIFNQGREEVKNGQILGEAWNKI